MSVAGNVREVTMRWRERLLFEGGAPGRPAIAVDLSLEKYCSAVASLAPDIRISYDVALA